MPESVSRRSVDVLVSAQPFEHEDGVGIFHPNLGNNIFTPRLERHLVAGVAAEAVNAAPAPEQKDLCHIVPQCPAMRIVEFGEVFPDRTPCCPAT